MTTAYTPILKLALPVTGELNGTWGDVVNQNITSMVEQAIAGLATINSWTANSHTLTTADGTTSESRCAMLVADDDGAGNPSAAATIICPNVSKLYIVKNISGQTVTLKTAAGTGIAVPNNQTSFLFCDGTNVESCVTSIVDGNVAGNLTVQGNATVNGNTTLGNATSDTVTLTARVASVVSPSADNTYDLGSTANSWKDLYIDGTAYLALVDINGGTIDGTTIGGTTPAAGSFTTLSASSTVSGTGFSNYLASPPAIGGTAAAAGTFTNLAYTGTLTGGTGVINIGSGQVYKDASGNVGIGTAAPSSTLHLSKAGGVLLKLGTSLNTSEIEARESAGANLLVFSSNNSSDDMVLNSSGNLGLGVTPSAWGSGYKAIQINGRSSIASDNGNRIWLNSDCFYNGTNWVYGSSGASVSQYQVWNGQHNWFTAPSGTAGNAISFTQAMTLDASGNLGIGTGNLTFNGSAQRIQWNMSPAAISDRVFFQTSVTNGASDLNIMPNGTGFASNFTAFSSSDPANSAVGRFGISTSTGCAFINSFKLGTGVTLPIAFQIDSTERMRLDSSGNLGLGVTPSAWQSTSYKVLELPFGVSLFGQTDTPSMELTANAFINSSYTWTYKTSNFATHYRQYNGQHQWYTAPSGTAGNAISFTQAMTLDASGDLLVGTQSAGGRVTAYAGAGTAFYGDVTTTGSYLAQWRYSGTLVGSITTNGTTTAYNTGSDYRLKENVRPLTGALDRVMQLEPSEWDWKADGSQGVGFIAHKVQAIRPQAVTGTKDAVDADGKPIYQGMDASFLIADLTAAIQELKSEFDAYKAAHP